MTHRYPMVEVRWLDAVELGGWTEHDAIANKPMPSRTVGYLVAENRHAITVAGLVNDNHVALAVTIPRAMVQSVRRLHRSRRTDQEPR